MFKSAGTCKRGTIMNQKAEASQNSTVIQVRGNFSNGITLSECERLFQLLLTENFPKLEAAAAEKAKENTELLVKATFQKLNAKIDSISVEKLAEPDVQNTFNTAVMGAAKKGQKIDIDLLAELLESRIEKGNTNYIDNCIEVAVEIVPKLTTEMILLLPVLHFIQAIVTNDITYLDNNFGVIDDEYLSKCKGITPSQMKTIAATGAGSYMSIMADNTFNQMKSRYPQLNETDSELKFPRMAKVLKFYDENNLHQLTLTTPGQVIAIKMLSKFFTGISINSHLQ